MWALIKANLTWSAAAKFYIWAFTLASSLAAEKTDLPEWVPAALAVGGLILGWVKSQQPVPKAALLAPKNAEA